MGMKHKLRKNNNDSAAPIGEVFAEFIAQKEAQGLSNSSLRNYKQSYGYFLDFHDITDDTPITSIQPKHFFQWMNTLRLDGVRYTSINHYLRDCRAFFYWAMEHHYIEEFSIELMKGQEELPKMFSDEDIAKLLERPKPTDNTGTWRTWAIVNWVLATGNRAATICDVKVSDIDFKNKQIILSHTKNKKAQTVPLSPALETVLKEYMRKFELEEYLFPNIGNEQLTTNALAHSFNRYCKERGAERTNIHGLRHNFATMYIRNGGSQAKLTQLLGHSTLEMTRRYVKLVIGDLKEDFEVFSPLDNLKKGARRTNKLKGE